MGLCFNCHVETREAIETSHVVHGATSQEGGCAGCHAPHHSALPALQRDEQPQLCLNCHDQPIEVAGGAALTNMAVLLRDNPQLTWTAWDFHPAAGPTLIKNWDYEPTEFGKVVLEMLREPR